MAECCPLPEAKVNYGYPIVEVARPRCVSGFSTQEILYFTFIFAFLILTFSIVITGIEALRTTSLQFRIALTIETFVSLVAGYMYYRFLLSATNSLQLLTYRYLDWFITTPFLLLTLFVLLNPPNHPFPWGTFVLVVILNAIMLGAGYLAEMGRAPFFLSWLVGVIAYVGLILVIFFTFHPQNNPFFWFFVIIWGLYGIVFFLPFELKTIFYNILDVIAKAGLGIWTWALSVSLANVPTA